MAFIFKVTTTSSPQTFTIPCQNVGTFNATINWGDGGPTSSITAYNDADLAHSYATAGQYTITITGTFPNVYFNNGGDKLLVDEVVDLGDVGWLTLQNAFRGCSNMTAFNVGTADTSGVTNMTRMLRDCTGLTSLDLSTFSTTSVTTMGEMFYSCTGLTSLDVSGFNTASVVDMTYMFQNCSGLTSLDVSGFNTANVVDMIQMFYGCSGLTSLDVSGFDTSSVTNMNQMFRQCSGLTSLDVSGFDTSSVTTMLQMFYSCSGLTSLDVSGFDTSSVENVQQMFGYCTNLTGLQISGWDVSSVTTGVEFLLNANNALSTQEYNNTLRAWSQQSVQSGVTWHFGDATYDETHPDTGYYLDFDGLDDRLLLVATEIASSSNATLAMTMQSDVGETTWIFTSPPGGNYILAMDGSASTTLTTAGGSNILYRNDGANVTYATRTDAQVDILDQQAHALTIEETDLTVTPSWASGFEIGGSSIYASYSLDGRLYAWAAVDTRLDGRNRDLLENFMISRKTA